MNYLMLLAVIFANMRRIIYNILVLVLLITFTVVIATPLFRNYSSVSLLMEKQEADENKDNEKMEKEEEAKDKSSSHIKFLPLAALVSDFYMKNDLVMTMGFLSMPEMPPDQV